METWVDPRSKVDGWTVKIIDVLPDDFGGSTTALVELFDPEGNSQGEDTIFVNRQDVKIGRTYDAYIDGIMAMPKIKGVKNIPYSEVPEKYEDAYEWVFAKVADGTYWKSNGDSVDNPFDENSDSVHTQMNYEYFEDGKNDWDLITRIAWYTRDGKDYSDVKFERPQKVYKYFLKYKDDLMYQLADMGYDISGDEIEQYLKELASLKEAQFKIRKRKLAKGYSERKKLANRKRFAEGNLKGVINMRVASKNLREAHRSPEDIYLNHNYTTFEALKKLERKYDIENMYFKGDVEKAGLEPLNRDETNDFYVKVKEGFYRVYRDSDGHVEFVKGQEDPKMLEILNKIYTMYYGHVRPYDRAKMPPAMGNKALKDRLSKKKLLQSLFGDLLEKYDFEIEEADVNYDDAEDFDDGVGEGKYIWDEDRNYVKVINKENPEDYVIFAPSGDEVAATQTIYMTYYSPAHLTADPYYSSPEESDFEEGDIEFGDWFVDEEDYSGDKSFLEEADKKAIVDAFEDYLTKFVENL